MSSICLLIKQHACVFNVMPTPIVLYINMLVLCVLTSFASMAVLIESQVYLCN